jgi:hypothetical protein
VTPATAEVEESPMTCRILPPRVDHPREGSTQGRFGGGDCETSLQSVRAAVSLDSARAFYREWTRKVEASCGGRPVRLDSIWLPERVRV